MTSEGFTHWAEPQPVWVRDGISLYVGGGEATTGYDDGRSKAFLAIQTPHSNSWVTLPKRALDELIHVLSEISAVMPEDGTS